MTSTSRFTLTGTVLEAPDARELARFYRDLLGWTVTADESDWVKLTPPEGGVGLAFQTEPTYAKPTWPARAGDQSMMMHLDIEVEDLFVPDERAPARDAPEERREKGPITVIGSTLLYAMGFCSTTLGLGRRMLETYAELARGKHSRA